MQDKSGVQLLVELVLSIIGIFLLPIAVINLISNVTDYWSWVLGFTALSLAAIK